MKLFSSFLNKVKEKAMHIYAVFCGAATPMLLSYNTVYAAGSGTEKIDKFLDFACDWLVKIGGTIGLVGGVMFALSWQRDDAEGKSKALMTIMAGLMLIAVAQTRDIFFS